MTTTYLPTATTGPAAPPDPAQVFQHAIAALQQAIDKKPETDRLLGEMVRLSGQALAGAGAGLFVTETPDHPELLLEHRLAHLGLLQDQAPLAGLALAVRRAVREAKPLIVPAFFIDNEAGDLPVNPSPCELLFIPMRIHGRIAMVLVMAVTPTAEAALHRVQIAFLQRMTALAETALAQRHLSLVERDRGVSTQLVQFSEQVHRHLGTRQVAIDLANLTRDLVAAQRVCVELYPRLKRKVVAVSNVDEPNKRSAILQAQRLLFEYVRDRNVPVVLDREAARQLVSDPLLQDAAVAYFAASDFDAFLAAPIRAAVGSQDEKVVGVIVAEYRASAAAQEHSPLLSDLARLSATAVANALEYEAMPFRHTFHFLADLVRKPATTKRRLACSIAGAVAVLAVLVAVIPFDFALKADCTVQPVAQLPIVAPMDGRIVEVPVRSGVHVHPKAAGDGVSPLVVFDTTDLLASRAQQQQKEAELHVELKSVQDKGEISKIGAAQLQLKQVEDQIKLLDHQIAQATVYSPIEGTVLTENIEQKKWASVRMGDPLLEVASFADWVLVVDVPESEAATVRDALAKSASGVEVEYILYPWPDTRYSIRAKGVATLLPASAQSRNANVFRLQIPLSADRLPPGIAMSGVTGRAKIHAGRQPLFTQYTRGLVRLIRMTVMF